MKIRHRFFLAAAFLFVAMAASYCSAPSRSAPAPAPPPVFQLVGGDTAWKPVVSVKELMGHIVMPSADNIWHAAGWRVTKKGVEELRPKNDDDWEVVESGAIALAEEIYLLKIPRPFAPDGDENDSKGPNAPELSPAQIQAAVAKDPVLWSAKIEALRNVALEVIEIVKRKNADELFTAGEDLDTACETCHLEFWYPSQKPRLQTGAKKP